MSQLLPFLLFLRKANGLLLAFFLGLLGETVGFLAFQDFFGLALFVGKP